MATNILKELAVTDRMFNVDFAVILTEKAMGKMRNCGMRNVESKMWNQNCGMTLIGRSDKPRDCWLSADYHTSLSTGSVVKCRPYVRK